MASSSSSGASLCCQLSHRSAIESIVRATRGVKRKPNFIVVLHAANQARLDKEIVLEGTRGFLSPLGSHELKVRARADLRTFWPVIRPTMSLPGPKWSVDRKLGELAHLRGGILRQLRRLALLQCGHRSPPRFDPLDARRLDRFAQ